MSTMIECDSCKGKMYDDSRSNRGDYHELWIDRTYRYHLCRKCYDRMMQQIMHMVFDDDEQQYVEIGSGAYDCTMAQEEKN